MDMYHNKVIELWTLYGFNFEHDFIEKAFAKEGASMIKHLQNKFEEAYERVGCHGAFFFFWAMLDDRNKRTLEDYVMDNYKG